MRKVFAVLLAAAALLAGAVPAASGKLLGYEGQPGNQGGGGPPGGGAHAGLLGYEGQPGNQGG
jgi:hypothetical protein